MTKIVFPDFPKKIYVKVETDGDDSYLVASADPADLTEKDVAIPAAEYVLAQAGVVIETKVVVTGGSAPEPTLPTKEVEAVERPEPQPQAEKKVRKPRSDAGQPRGPYKKDEPAAPATRPADAPESSPAPAPMAAVPAEQPAKELTIDDLKAAMTILAKKKNIEANMAVLRRFGVGQVSKLPVDKYPAFLAAVKAAAEAA